jgi:hypothetical protein
MLHPVDCGILRHPPPALFPVGPAVRGKAASYIGLHRDVDSMLSRLYIKAVRQVVFADLVCTDGIWVVSRLAHIKHARNHKTRQAFVRTMSPSPSRTSFDDTLLYVEGELSSSFQPD